MPELPEVESVKRQLIAPLTGRRIAGAWFDFHPHARMHRVAAAIGATIREVNRRGKYLILPLDYLSPRSFGQAPVVTQPAVTSSADNPRAQALLVIHLGMSGSLRIDAGSAAAGEDPYDRAAVLLDGNSVLRFRDPRRFGRFSVTTAQELPLLIPTLANLGPEPLSSRFDPHHFAQRLRQSSAPVKALLLGQRVVAGVGNIYADEALWRSQVHPDARHVGPRRARRLHQHLRDVLTEAIEREGTTFRDYQMVNGESGRNAPFLQVYGNSGQPCQRCGVTLIRRRIAQRGTTFCPHCQYR